MDMFFLVQAVLGGLLVLFFPGYAWARLLFREKELDKIEIVAVSIAISIAIVPLAVFYLNKFLGVAINISNVVLTALVLTAVPLVFLYLKKFTK